MTTFLGSMVQGSVLTGFRAARVRPGSFVAGQVIALPMALSVTPALPNIKCGEEVLFTAVMLFDDGTYRVLPATWTVPESPFPVATIELSTGVATGVGAGIVEVTAVPLEFPAFHAHASLTVGPNAAGGASFNTGWN